MAIVCGVPNFRIFTVYSSSADSVVIEIFSVSCFSNDRLRPTWNAKMQKTKTALCKHHCWYDFIDIFAVSHFANFSKRSQLDWSFII